MIQDLAAETQRSKDPKKFITPYAFSVSPELYGTALASPVKRLLAILIDLIVVLLLAELSSMLLAGLMAVLFWQISRRFTLAGERPVLRVFLRMLASLILFGMALLYFAEADLQKRISDRTWNVELGDADVGDLSLVESAAYTGVVIQQSQRIREKRETMNAENCPSLIDCWQPFLDQFALQLVEMDAPAAVSEQLMDVVIEETGVNAGQAETLRNNLPIPYQSFLDEKSGVESTSKTSEAPSGEATVPHGNVDQGIDVNTAGIDEVQSSGDNAAVYEGNSIMGFIHALLADLGLGFGWAAFYFSVMNARFTGQTVGKYVLGLKVIKLNGDPMGLWESFGRYGGYGAGIATGLMGFVQIFWDPNRQAIQDKISETLVIDQRKPKYQWPVE
ncbi:RDD family protein [Pseudoteredinibacter isoporae]|uniref:RDD family protein n=1 Tax=Pseudoteredinibacter isoporae TaxID=570281 RepID=UPI0031065295